MPPSNTRLDKSQLNNDEPRPKPTTSCSMSRMTDGWTRRCTAWSSRIKQSMTIASGRRSRSSKCSSKARRPTRTHSLMAWEIQPLHRWHLSAWATQMIMSEHRPNRWRQIFHCRRWAVNHKEWAAQLLLGLAMTQVQIIPRSFLSKTLFIKGSSSQEIWYHVINKENKLNMSITKQIISEAWIKWAISVPAPFQHNHNTLIQLAIQSQEHKVMEAKRHRKYRRFN